jgi:nucleoside diphosphate kinase
LAKENEPKSLRALYGTDSIKNAVHGSKSEEAAKREIKFFFPMETPLLQRTLALIKPDAVSKSLEIVQYIEDQGFKIVHHETIQFTTESAAGFCITHSNKAFYDNYISWLSR